MGNSLGGVALDKTKQPISRLVRLIASLTSEVEALGALETLTRKEKKELAQQISVLLERLPKIKNILATTDFFADFQDTHHQLSQIKRIRDLMKALQSDWQLIDRELISFLVKGLINSEKIKQRLFSRFGDDADICARILEDWSEFDSSENGKQLTGLKLVFQLSCSGFTQMEISDLLDISQSSVGRRLEQANTELSEGVMCERVRLAVIEEGFRVIRKKRTGMLRIGNIRIVFFLAKDLHKYTIDLFWVGPEPLDGAKQRKRFENLMNLGGGEIVVAVSIEARRELGFCLASDLANLKPVKFCCASLGDLETAGVKVYGSLERVLDKISKK